jgi:hypothetical protein
MPDIRNYKYSSLCLTNEALRLEIVCTDPHFLGLSTNWYSLDRRLDGPQIRSRQGEVKISILPGLEI